MERECTDVNEYRPISSVLCEFVIQKCTVKYLLSLLCKQGQMGNSTHLKSVRETFIEET